VDDYLGTWCTDCPIGTFTPAEGQSSCEACDRPLCSGITTSCDSITGELGTYSYMIPAVAAATICDPDDLGARANSTYIWAPADACDAPEYCRSDALQCNTEPNR
jgi:hypothetical protein